MANRIVPRQQAIEFEKESDCDRYTGPAERLIEAGIVSREQLPPPGRIGVTFAHGKPFRRFSIHEPTALRVEWRRDGLLTVRKALTADALAARQRLEDDKRARLSEAFGAEKAEKEQLLAIDTVGEVFKYIAAQPIDALEKRIADWRAVVGSSEYSPADRTRFSHYLRAAALHRIENMTWDDWRFTPQAKADARRAIDKAREAR